MGLCIGIYVLYNFLIVHFSLLQTSSTTTTTTMTTQAAKLYGKDLSVYDDLDVDTLLSQLSPEEISLLAKEVDPDVSVKIHQHTFFFPIFTCSFLFVMHLNLWTNF